MSRSRERLEALAAGVSVRTPDNSDLVGEAPVRSQTDREVKTIRTRQRGVFNGTNKRLEVLTQIPGYVQRWFNETPGRLERAESGGWEFVERSEVSLAESNKVVERNSDVGNRIRAIVGTTDQNTPLYAYLMKIKQEWFEEDQQESVQTIAKSERDMLRNGGMNTDRIGEKYLPDQRKQALVVQQGEFGRTVS
jgi:hypothetical protein